MTTTQYAIVLALFTMAGALLGWAACSWFHEQAARPEPRPEPTDWEKEKWFPDV